MHIYCSTAYGKVEDNTVSHFLISYMKLMFQTYTFFILHQTFLHLYNVGIGPVVWPQQYHSPDYSEPCLWCLSFNRTFNSHTPVCQIQLQFELLMLFSVKSTDYITAGYYDNALAHQVRLNPQLPDTGRLLRLQPHSSGNKG